MNWLVGIQKRRRRWVVVNTAMSIALSLGSLLVISPALADESADVRLRVEQFWQSKGLSPEAAKGVADNVQRESGFNPTLLGDSQSSLGLYQHHDGRLTSLLVDMENDAAFKDFLGRDVIASQHWQEIKNAPDRATAARLWARYFERCAACSSGSPRNSTASQKTTRTHLPVIPDITTPHDQADVTPASFDPFSPDRQDRASSFLITQERK